MSTHTTTPDLNELFRRGDFGDAVIALREASAEVTRPDVTVVNSAAIRHLQSVASPIFGLVLEAFQFTHYAHGFMSLATAAFGRASNDDSYALETAFIAYKEIQDLSGMRAAACELSRMCWISRLTNHYEDLTALFTIDELNVAIRRQIEKTRYTDLITMVAMHNDPLITEELGDALAETVYKADAVNIYLALPIGPKKALEFAKKLKPDYAKERTRLLERLNILHHFKI